jgi:sigma-B regulation protein RsbU (phosphoserine phosphatase)
LVDIRRNGLHYINAGHCPPILVRGDTAEVCSLDEGGTVIGLFPKTEYKRGSVNLQPGDVLVCCTDGILEACNFAEDEFGKERLANCVAHNRHLGAQEIVEAVLREVNAFAIGGRYTDDKVLMVMKVTADGKVQTAKQASWPKEKERRTDPRIAII